MAIFNRRDLQRMLDENAAFLSRGQLQAHVDALNAKNVEPERYLSYEWEVAVLNAFSKVGRVDHEVNSGGASRPDLLFSQMNEDALIALIRAISPEASREVDRVIAEATEAPDDEEPFAFIADIATVSDEGLRDRNPVEAFQKEFIRLLKKHGLGHGFHYSIGSYSYEEFARSRTKVKLPPKGQLGALVFQTPGFKRFLRAVQQSPAEAHHVAFQGDNIDLTLSYQPGVRGMGGSHPSYRGISQFDPDIKEQNPSDRNLKNNGVYSALKSKADQLRKSGFGGRRGIIVCDGGCQLLGDTGTMQTRTAPEVVQKFLRESSSVDFVLWIYIAMVEPPHQPSGFFTSRLWPSSLSDRVPQVQTRLVKRPRELRLQKS